MSTNLSKEQKLQRVIEKEELKTTIVQFINSLITKKNHSIILEILKEFMAEVTVHQAEDILKYLEEL